MAHLKEKSKFYVSLKKHNTVIVIDVETLQTNRKPIDHLTRQLPEMHAATYYSQSLLAMVIRDAYGPSQ